MAIFLKSFFKNREYNRQMSATVLIQATITGSQFFIFQIVLFVYGISNFSYFAISTLALLWLPIFDFGKSIKILKSDHEAFFLSVYQLNSLNLIAALFCFLTCIAVQWLGYANITLGIAVLLSVYVFGKGLENSMRGALVSQGQVSENSRSIGMLCASRVAVIALSSVGENILLTFFIYCITQLWPIVILVRESLFRFSDLRHIDFEFNNHFHGIINIFLAQLDRLVALLVFGFKEFTMLSAIYAFSGVLGMLAAPMANNMLSSYKRRVDLPVLPYVIVLTTVGFVFYLGTLLVKPLVDMVAPEFYLYGFTELFALTIVFQVLITSTFFVNQRLISVDRTSFLNKVMVTFGLIAIISSLGLELVGFDLIMVLTCLLILHCIMIGVIFRVAKKLVRIPGSD